MDSYNYTNPGYSVNFNALERDIQQRFAVHRYRYSGRIVGVLDHKHFMQSWHKLRSLYP